MLYNDWLSTLTGRYAGMLDGMAAMHNFDLGTEFEIVLAHFLARILPARYGVCRGFIVPERGAPVGDDIIIYDQSRFPSLRGNGGDLSRKEAVPAEAVIAYVEAKHTLTQGALEKAVTQIAAVKQVTRAKVTYQELLPGMLIGEQLKLSGPGPGWPPIRNPWYACIIARNVAAELSTAADLREALKTLVTRNLTQVPEVLSAGPMLVMPCLQVEGGQELRPFITDGVASSFINMGHRSFPLAICHLLWAIEHVVPAQVKWSDLLIHETKEVRPELVSWFKNEAPQ